MVTPNERNKAKNGLLRSIYVFHRPTIAVARPMPPHTVRKVLRVLICFVLIFAAFLSSGCSIAIDDPSPTPSGFGGDVPHTDWGYPSDPNSTFPPNWNFETESGTDQSTSPPAALPPTADSSESDYVMHNLIFPWNMSGKNSSNAPVYEVEPFVLSFLLPKGWKCLSRPAVSELYLDAKNGTDTGVGVVYSIYWIYDETDVCVGAVGYDLYRAFSSHEDDPDAIYSMINDDEYYRFATDEYYYPVYSGTSNVTALTQVLVSAEWLKSYGVQRASDRLHIGILSYDKDCGVYAAFDIFPESLNSIELMDVAGSIRFSSAG